MTQYGQKISPSLAQYVYAKQPMEAYEDLTDTRPVVQGIQLIPVTVLPDRLQMVFPFQFFNAVQSKCFGKVFGSSDNFVLASPTASGKTAILELAICRTMDTSTNDQYKIVYQAPTKALCSERYRDWEAKLHPIGLKCAELTGDSDATNLRNVQSAHVIITTPEKWDSITRRWKDHQKLMTMIRLFLIDEVHILKEDRGAVLETVVSRMKSIGTCVRFLALSATVPNIQDVAAWLGKNSLKPYEPAMYEIFGEEFRPVKLRKHVCGYACNNSNDFAFERLLDSKLPELISKYSERKPVMVFCVTRNSAVNTARILMKWWLSQPVVGRAWNVASRRPHVLNRDLREVLTSGVAFHHAGLDLNDRIMIEKAFLNGEVSVICCTSTLAVGVNLPCHLVIIKNTMAFTANGLQEYSDLEVMQMLGRAGRPQFENSATAVIMTRQSKVHQYERMVSGRELLESRLHLNLIDHVNAEIVLGTIYDLFSARQWLMGTFLYVRLQQNPSHYKLKDSTSGQNIQEQVDDICFRDIALLRENSLISGQDCFRATEFGQAMAQYYVHFETMRTFMDISKNSSPSEILSAIAQATEFLTIRFRQGEKSFYKMLNKSPSIRWPISVNLDLSAQKVSLIIQSLLGSADINWSGEMGKYRAQYVMEAQMIFRSTSSLIRCIIDCQACLEDAVGIHSALMLERSFASQAWDDSPLQMKQIEGIGVVAVRKLVNAGIRCMDDLESCEAHRIEMVIGRNPPFGIQTLAKVKLFPKLRVSLRVDRSSIIKVHAGVEVQVKVEVGFMNDKPPQRFGDKLIYVCLLVETSDGRKAHFARISGSKLGKGQILTLPVLLTSFEQDINCYVMCDGIAGSMRSASVKPQIAHAMFSSTRPVGSDIPPQSNTSKRRVEDSNAKRKLSASSEEYGDDEIDDEELVEASFDHLSFDHIDKYTDPTKMLHRYGMTKNSLTKHKQHATSTDKSHTIGNSTPRESDEPVQLANGKWECNHKCKDRSACKHLCCKQGIDKPPKKKVCTVATQLPEIDSNRLTQKISDYREGHAQVQLNPAVMNYNNPRAIKRMDLTQENADGTQPSSQESEYLQDSYQTRRNAQTDIVPSNLQFMTLAKSAHYCTQGNAHSSSRKSLAVGESRLPSELDDIHYEETLPTQFAAQKNTHQMGTTYSAESQDCNDYAEGAFFASQVSDLCGGSNHPSKDAVVDLEISETLRETCQEDTHAANFSDVPSLESEASHYSGGFGTNVNKMLPDLDLLGDTIMSNVKPSSNSLASETLLTKANTGSEVKPIQYDSKAERTISMASRLDKAWQGSSSLLTKFEGTVKEKDKADDICLLVASRDESTSRIESDIKSVSNAYADLEPWIFQEFGDIVELVEE